MTSVVSRRRKPEAENRKETEEVSGQLRRKEGREKKKKNVDVVCLLLLISLFNYKAIIKLTVVERG